ncbi:MAG: hypothetical protein ACREF9_11900 [Opitutaceae bacterium]
MRASGQHHALSAGRECATLLTLGAVQFTHILDFMIMMPLGAQLMRVFNISPAQFTYLVTIQTIWPTKHTNHTKIRAHSDSIPIV